MGRGVLQVLDTLAEDFSAMCLTGCEHVVFPPRRIMRENGLDNTFRICVSTS